MGVTDGLTDGIGVTSTALWIYASCGKKLLCTGVCRQRHLWFIVMYNATGECSTDHKLQRPIWKGDSSIRDTHNIQNTIKDTFVF